MREENERGPIPSDVLASALNRGPCWEPKDPPPPFRTKVHPQPGRVRLVPPHARPKARRGCRNLEPLRKVHKGQRSCLLLHLLFQTTKNVRRTQNTAGSVTQPSVRVGDSQGQPTTTTSERQKACRTQEGRRQTADSHI